MLATRGAPAGPHQNALINAFDLRSVAQAYRTFAQTYEPLVDRVPDGAIGPSR